ncbi:MAG: hypothetical protein SNJ64_02180, partial [Endomicrobiia bacterium]
YKQTPTIGLSSALDWAIGCGRPIAVSSSSMFCTVNALEDGIYNLDKYSLDEILDADMKPLRKLREQGSKERVLDGYEKVLKTR